MQGTNTKADLPPTLPEIAALIIRGRSGDRRAMEALIRRYQGRIAKFVLSQTGDDAQYEDICQTVFVQMVLALPRLRSNERFESWLFQIARNACRDHLRKQRRWRKQFVSIASDHDSVVDPHPIDSNAKDEMIERGIDQLPAPQQTLLRLSLGRAGRSYQELALASNLSVSAVKSRLFRARESLRAMLLRLEGESQ